MYLCTVRCITVRCITFAARGRRWWRMRERTIYLLSGTIEGTVYKAVWRCDHVSLPLCIYVYV